ncbi:hypothetical protein [Epilithonimonas arachidiradicis]|uniref:Lipoprotein n=1 Tax=Epilithonimonas arachidiradicis TaxID=1617282 RepID=A0A420CXE1_9FLAO|nr:hypothetical protein [Epilithonimonas arachidiradicis]RKE83149.1 hypothetical protein BXY58_2701 [Epilithonimonas arachidiradicis]GGG65325.1 hypothetical protein GCM10007332_29760 [Epilithonimonas arachidiradicis]
MRKYIAYIILLLILINCNSSVKPGDSVINEEIPYKEAQNYFVKNNIDAAMDSPKFETQEAFDQVFGMATIMGKNGKPTPIDFSREFVVAQIEDPSNQTIKLELVSIRKNSNILEVKYRKSVGEDQSYITQAAMILIIDKKYEGDVNFVEVK